MKTIFDETLAFIRKVFNEPEKMIYLHEPRFIGNEKKYLLETIDSTFISSVGPFVDKFEAMMTATTGAKYAVACVNGTAALHMALIVAGVTPGVEVITQSLSFVATANAIAHCGAIPHFVDVDKDTMGMSPASLEHRLNEIAEIRNGVCFNKITNRPIKACVPMHTFGFPLEIGRIADICKQWNIVLVEDAAESLGSYVGQQHTGTFGVLGVFSFNGNKTVTCGGGGAIVTNDEALAKKAKHLTTTAKKPHAWEYVHDEVAYNYRMPNLNAAVACAQLEQLDKFLDNKRELADMYASFFKGKIRFVTEREGTKANYWLNTLLLDNKEEKEAFLAYSNERKVMTRPAWKLMHQLEMYKDCPKGETDNAVWLEERIVNIPSSVRV